jgi:hypothetical protein
VRVEGRCYTDELRVGSGAAPGHVLTADGQGVGTWQAPASVPDGDWTISGSDIYSSVAGNVGIGTTAPAARLEAEGGTGTAGRFGSSGIQGDITLEVQNTAGTASKFEAGSPPTSYPGNPTAVYGSAGGSAHAAHFVAWGDGRGVQVFSEGSGHALYADGGGGGYAGYFTGGSGVRVEGNCSVEGFQLTTGPTAGHVLTSDGAGAGSWQPPVFSDDDWNVSGDDMYSGVSGNVGIGTSSPAAKLDVSTSGVSQGLRLVHGGTTARVVGLERDSMPAAGQEVLYLKVPAGAPDGSRFVECERGTSEEFAVLADGSVESAGGATFAGDVDVAGALTVETHAVNAGYFSTTYVSSSAAAVEGEVTGTGSANAIGVYGHSCPSSDYGVGGFFSGCHKGVGARSNNAGGSGTHYALHAEATYGSGSAYAVYATASNAPVCYGIYASAPGSGNYAGYFNGNVHVSGTLSKSAGLFKIDHPLDPASMYLNHSFVESPDMMNVYNGNVVLDGAGEAWVELPEWFEVLNRDFRYQLTPLDAPAPNLYVADRISSNRFRIAGGAPGIEVSWQVTGVRQDRYAEANRIVVEEPKPPSEAGRYLNPELYGMPGSLGIGYAEQQ